MKKLITSLVALAGFTAASYAQRSADLSGVVLSPVTDYVLPCNDSFDVAYLIINEGPDALIAGDTIRFYTNIVEKDFIRYTVLTTGVNMGDTVYGAAYKMKASQIASYWDVTASTIKYAPVPNGDIGFFIAPYASNTDLARTTQTIPLFFNKVSYTCNTTGINDFAKTQLGVFPNPAQNQITLNFDATAAAGTVRVFDVMGRTILTQAIAKNTSAYTLDISSLNNGSYFVELVSGDVRGINKFTVSK